MKEYFEHAYQGTVDSVHGLMDFCANLVNVLIVCFVYITIPIWVLPYAIYDKYKKED